MLGTHDEALGDLLDDACKVAAARRGTSGVDPDTVRTLLEAYYHHVAPEDLIGRDAEDVYGAAMSQYRLAARRPQGTATVQVTTPTVDEHGWSAAGHTVVEVVTDDMPFLVDSVTMLLARHDHGIHLVVHPQLLVVRDVTGDAPGPGPRRARRRRRLRRRARVVDARGDRPGRGRRAPGRAGARSAPTCCATCASRSRTGPRCRTARCRSSPTCARPAPGAEGGGRRGLRAAALAGRQPLHVPRLPRVRPRRGEGEDGPTCCGACPAPGSGSCAPTRASRTPAARPR